MKRLLLVVFIFLPSASIATPVDSMLGPFRLPLSLGFRVNGLFHHDNFQQSMHDSGTGVGSFSDTLNAERTASSNYVLRGDTIRWFSYSTLMGSLDTTIYDSTELILDSTSHTVTKLSIIHSLDVIGGSFHENDYWSILLSGFRYDSLIYCDDSNLASHIDSVHYSHFVNPQDHFGLYERGDLRTVYSVDLSGIFRPTHLVNPALSVAPPEAKTGISIRALNGELNCTFEASSHARMLEVFSPLGVRVATHSVAQGEYSATLPRLPAGLYFVRMESALVKVVLAE